MPMSYFIAPPLSRLPFRRPPAVGVVRAVAEDSALSELRRLQQNILRRRKDLRSRSLSSSTNSKSNPTSSDPPSSAVSIDQPVSAAKPVSVVTHPRPQDLHTQHVRRISPDQKNFIIPRGPGQLPWIASKRRPSQNVPVSYHAPLISLFYSPQYPRTDGLLPKAHLQFLQAIPDAEQRHTAEISQNHIDILAGLNDGQRKAVLSSTDRACLVLAGPGSGKTRVLTHRVAYLVKYHKISPYKILAVTFTNKAAEEMKKRVVNLLLGDHPDEDQASNLMSKLPVGTFHSLSARFLRQFGHEIDIPSDFGICDSQDCKSLLKRVLDIPGGAKGNAEVRKVLRSISLLKNDVNGAYKDRFRSMQSLYGKLEEQRQAYDQALRRMKLLDFDDLLVEMRRLLLSSPDALSNLQERFDQVLVDEWQDTNAVQFDIVSMLAGGKQNLFVVGDSDQSIYKFRGADSGNEQRFLNVFPKASSVSLGTNYRSTQRIVQAAQHVIEQSRSRFKKSMVSINGFGKPINLCETLDNKREANFVVRTLHNLVRSGEISSFSEVALLYRMNAQSRSLEEACINAGVPYYIRSGVRFYERKEIKDLVAYVSLIVRPEDDIAFLRTVNTPPRGIGSRTIEALEAFAKARQVPLATAAQEIVEHQTANGESTDIRKGAVAKLANFCDLLAKLRTRAERVFGRDNVSNVEKDSNNLSNLFQYIVEKIGYIRYLEDHSEEEKKIAENSRIDNVRELISSSAKYNTVQSFLETVSLLTETDRDLAASRGGAVSLMTLHGGKGLEFDAVFITGAEDGVIPLVRSSGNDADIEEERRLLYVGMTRARKVLYITWRSVKFGSAGGKTFSMNTKGASRFLLSLPKELVHMSFPHADNNRNRG